MEIPGKTAILYGARRLPCAEGTFPQSVGLDSQKGRGRVRQRGTAIPALGPLGSPNILPTGTTRGDTDGFAGRYAFQQIHRRLHGRRRVRHGKRTTPMHALSSGAAEGTEGRGQNGADFPAVPRPGTRALRSQRLINSMNLGLD